MKKFQAILFTVLNSRLMPIVAVGGGGEEGRSDFSVAVFSTCR
jgi:hypothetical protein